MDRREGVFVASPIRGASWRLDGRRQPPAPYRLEWRNWPDSPQYGFGWSATSKHLLRSPQSQKTDQKQAPTVAPGSPREPGQYIRFVLTRRIVSSPKTTFSWKRFGKSARIFPVSRFGGEGRRRKLSCRRHLRPSVARRVFQVPSQKYRVLSHSAASRRSMASSMIAPLGRFLIASSTASTWLSAAGRPSASRRYVTARRPEWRPRTSSMPLAPTISGRKGRYVSIFLSRPS